MSTEFHSTEHLQIFELINENKDLHRRADELQLRLECTLAENAELKQQLQCTRELRAVELKELKLKTELAAEARTENNALRNLFDERATENDRLSRELALANISTLKLRGENAELKLRTE